MSRMTSSDHLSPTRSSVLATAQGERRNPSGLFPFALIRSCSPDGLWVTCRMQFIMLRCLHSCKMQVTGRGETHVKRHIVAFHTIGHAQLGGNESACRGCADRLACARNGFRGRPSLRISAGDAPVAD